MTCEGQVDPCVLVPEKPACIKTNEGLTISIFIHLQGTQISFQVTQIVKTLRGGGGVDFLPIHSDCQDSARRGWGGMMELTYWEVMSCT